MPWRRPSRSPASKIFPWCSSTGATPSYTALIDAQGELIAGLADMELYEVAFAKQLRRATTRQAVAGADAVLTDANLPAPALATLAELAEATPRCSRSACRRPRSCAWRRSSAASPACS